MSDVHAIATGGTHAVVTWTTDRLAGSRVRYGSGALGSTAETDGFTTSHSVLLTGLQPGTTYRYDVESGTPTGEWARDSLDGSHRTFTARRAGSIALLMDDPDPEVLAAWNNAFDALGWDVDVQSAAANDPPLVGSSATGLRHYAAVLWQVGPDRYPPFSDAQRAAIDSLLDGGGRLLVTGHDIGFGLSDAGCPSYTPEREAWLESGLKTRYYVDNIYADALRGVAGSPISGAWTAFLPYAYWLYPDSGDNMGPAPNNGGVWSADWIDNVIGAPYMGMHWESSTPRGTAGTGVWGGQSSRLVGLFHEWSALAGGSVAHHPERTGALANAAAWLMGHRPPEIHLLSPAAGTVQADDFVAIRYSVRPDAGRAIVSRLVEYSLDGGESWAAITTAACTDSGCIWDLAGALGGEPTPNSGRVMVRVRVTDDGTPALAASATTAGTFALVRGGGDHRGPALVAGSASCSPMPLRTGQPATLVATFSDAETGGGGVAGAEYSIGAAPAAAGGGAPMSGTFGGSVVRASAALPTGNVSGGALTLWVRGRDAAGNWGSATALVVPTSGNGVTGAEAAPAVDFLAPPTPNPSRADATVRFGLARAGNARVELFDLSGRRVRTLVSGPLAAGPHATRWDGRDARGQAVGAGVYFVRLSTPARTFHARVVRLNH